VPLTTWLGSQFADGSRDVAGNASARWSAEGCADTGSNNGQVKASQVSGHTSTQSSERGVQRVGPTRPLPEQSHVVSNSPVGSAAA